MRLQSSVTVKSSRKKHGLKDLDIDETYYFDGVEIVFQGTLLYVRHMVEWKKKRL